MIVTRLQAHGPLCEVAYGRDIIFIFIRSWCPTELTARAPALPTHGASRRGPEWLRTARLLHPEGWWQLVHGVRGHKAAESSGGPQPRCARLLSSAASSLGEDLYSSLLWQEPRVKLLIRPPPQFSMAMGLASLALTLLVERGIWIFFTQSTLEGGGVRLLRAICHLHAIRTSMYFNLGSWPWSLTQMMTWGKVPLIKDLLITVKHVYQQPCWPKHQLCLPEQSGI